jgi:hypothetical protein
MNIEIRVQVFEDAPGQFRAVATTTPKTDTFEFSHSDPNIALYWAAVYAGSNTSAPESAERH